MLAADAAQMMELPSASPKGTSVACRDSKNFVHAGSIQTHKERYRERYAWRAASPSLWAIRENKMADDQDDLILEPAAKRTRFDDAIDTSQQAVGSRSEARAAVETFGPTQGAAGDRIPETTGASERQTGEESVSDFTLGVVGPTDRFASDGDKDGADAALYAADRAHKHCQTEDAMLDAMEAAEAQYDAQKQPDPKRLSGLIEDALNSSSHAPASPRGVSRKDSGQQKPLLVPDATREKVRERILVGLQKNSHLSSSQHDLAQIAAECEDTCYSKSKSKVTYLSKAGNATRLASTLTAAEVPELARIASGQAKTVVENRVTEPAQPGALTGGQAITMKPMTGAAS